MEAKFVPRSETERFVHMLRLQVERQFSDEKQKQYKMKEAKRSKTKHSETKRSKTKQSKTQSITEQRKQSEQ
jgi:hypothetical protein